MARELWTLYSVVFIICSALIIKSTTAQFPNFDIQANDSLLTAGDTVIIDCLLYNASVLDIMNDYDIAWFKDEIKLTQAYTRLRNDVINDQRYSISIEVKLNIGTVSTMQITSITTEDEGVFTCELTNRMNVKQRKSISISVEDPEDRTIATDIKSVISDPSFNHNKRLFTKWTDAEEGDNLSNTPSINIFTNSTTDIVKFSEDVRDNNLTYPTDSNISPPTDSSITTPANSNITYPAESNTSTPTDGNITTPANSNITYPADSNISTPADGNSTTPLLFFTENILENTSASTGIEKREDDKVGLIAGITVLVVVLVLFLVLMSIYYARRRNILNCKSCYDKARGTNRKYDVTPRENIHGYENVLPKVYHDVYVDPASEIETKPRRRPYEDANDRTFLNEYEVNEHIRRGSSDGIIGRTDTLEKVELLALHPNTSDQNLLDAYRNASEDTSDGNLDPVPEFKIKPKRRPYEDANDRTFLNEYEINKHIRGGSSDGGNDRTDTLGKMELPHVHHNTSNQTLFPDSHNTSDDTSNVTYELKKKTSPYESCNSMNFLKDFA
ncbi:uncharacterized protein LOC130049081 [Ostrea edulis]|uniref:uncharacterized protein LOC130049081 n=1 Tax=Ostrea edulis TaxID=37623 RepID=UPI0024AF2F76|nr:uncharacterized protein LOC130049081 [Ostrea edulis]